MKRAPTFIDIFSGAGLFSAGFLAAGFRPLLAIDQDADAIATYRANVSDCGQIADATKPFDIGPVDVVLAGPPCQGFSTLGLRNPSDIRNRAALAIDKWVELATPFVVVVENVPPFLQSSTWRRLSKKLISRGYHIATWILDAADYNTPQRRIRAFTIASKVSLPTPPKSAGRYIPSRVAFGRRISPSDPMHAWPSHAGIAEKRIALVPPLGDRRDILLKAPELCPPSWFQLGCQVTDAWGRIDPDRPANTLRCSFQNPSKGRYLHPTQPRVISLREGARLQGVPDSWQFVGGRYSVTTQIGNGVPIPLGSAVAQTVRTLLS